MRNFYPRTTLILALLFTLSAASAQLVNEKKNSSIYNITNNKLVRKIPLKDQTVSRSIYPAKEGHVMIREYNSKEKYTRVSIEAL